MKGSDSKKVRPFCNLIQPGAVSLHNKQRTEHMNFNNIQALATAAIYATNARCNDAQAQELEDAISAAFIFADRQVTVTFKGTTYTIVKSNGQYALTIG